MIDPHTITTAEQLSHVLADLGFVTDRGAKIDNNPLNRLIEGEPNHHNHVRVAVTSDGLELELYDDLHTTFRLWELIRHPIAEGELRQKIHAAASFQAMYQLLWEGSTIVTRGSYLVQQLGTFVAARNLGWVWQGWVPIQTDSEPSMERYVDAVFIAKERLAERVFPSVLRVAPELVIELHTEHHRSFRQPEKVAALLRFGVRCIWLFDPQEGVLEVVRPGQPRQWLKMGDVVCGEGRLVGFCIPIDELMAIEPRLSQSNPLTTIKPRFEDEP
jgi:Uma2 family endonuclease